MIKVNLLPPDLRTVEHTPFPRLIAIIGGITLNILLVMWLVFYHAKWIPDAERLKETEEGRLAGLREQEKIYDGYVAETTTINTVGKTITTLQTQRIEVTKRLDELIDIIPRNIWLSKLELKPEKEPKTSKDKPENAALILTCRTWDDPNYAISNLRRRMQAQQKGLDSGLQKQMVEFLQNLAGLSLVPSVEKSKDGFEFTQQVNFALRGDYGKK